MNTKSITKNKKTFGEFISAWGIIIALVVIIIIFSVMMPDTFATFGNAVDILRNMSITTVIAMGATLTISLGVFDLSFGSTATLGGALGLSFMVWYGLPMGWAIVAAIVVSMIVGVINSLLVIKARIPAFLATLTMMFIIGGVALTYSGGGVITAARPGFYGQQIVAKVPELYWQFGQAPGIIIIMLVITFLVFIFQTFTKHGRYIYMAGQNSEAARLTGVPVNKYITLAFLLSAALSAIGGMLIVARVQTLQTGAGGNYLMPAIAAVSIGTSVAGAGKPNAIGTLIGALVMGVVENGLFMLSFPYFAIDIVRGAILIIALMMSYTTTKKAA